MASSNVPILDAESPLHSPNLREETLPSLLKTDHVEKRDDESTGATSNIVTNNDSSMNRSSVELNNAHDNLENSNRSRYALTRRLKPFQLPPAYITHHRTLTIEVNRRQNVQYIEYGVLVCVVGNTVQLVDLFSRRRRILEGPHAGIGAVAVHPKRTHLAIGTLINSNTAATTQPVIIIYNYPDLQPVCMLHEGANRGYASLAFDSGGRCLAAQATGLDYTLTVFDWESERVVLRTKSFSQDVFSVQFSPNDDTRLITAGQGHIRFWTMANTFTGLKLQGQSGKFGRVPSSDIYALVELPDGKVLTGTNSGTFLLWEGNMVQSIVYRPGHHPCHIGAIECIALDGRHVVSTGADGYLRHWSLDVFEYNEATDGDDINLYIDPVLEVCIGEDMHIIGMIRGDDHWLLQDAHGSFVKLWIPKNEVEVLFNVHSGPVKGILPALDSHTTVSAGLDGTLRSWNVVHGEETLVRRFESGISCMLWASTVTDAKRSTLIVGFVDGTLRVLQRFVDRFLLKAALKPHTCCITCLAATADGGMLATASDDGTIFFIVIKADTNLTQLIPVGLVRITALSIQWSLSDSLLWASTGTDIVAISRPHVSSLEPDDSRESYLLQLEIQKYRPRLFDSSEPHMYGPIHTVHDAHDRIWLAVARTASVESRHIETIYDVNLKTECVIRSLYLGSESGAASHISYSDSGRFLLVGTDQGYVQMRSVDDIEYFFSTKLHASQAVTSVATSFDDRFLFSAGEDGNIFEYVVDPTNGLMHADRDIINRIHADILRREAEHKERQEAHRKLEEELRQEAEENGVDFVPPKIEVDTSDPLDFDHLGLLVSADAKPEVTVPQEISENSHDILDSQVVDMPDVSSRSYSIEEAKLKAEEDDRQMAAEKRKEAMRKEIDILRREFQYIMKKNSQLDRSQQIPRTAFELDPKLRTELELEVQRKMEAVRAELAWVTEKHELQLKKLRAKFLDDVIVEHISIKAFRANSTVSTFRTAKMSPQLRHEIDQIQSDIEAEQTQKNSVSTNNIASGTTEENNVVELVTGSLREQSLRRKPGISQADQRKQARLERQAAIARLQAAKPDKNVDDPVDIARVKLAEQNMGDFKLKSDPKYVVPEDHRVNAASKRRQILLLQENIFFMRMGFNERVLALRDLKSRIIKNIQTENYRVRELNSKLGIEQTLFDVQIDKQEWPEQRDVYTEEEFAQFQASKKQELRTQLQKNSGVLAGALGSFDDEDVNTGSADQDEKATDATTDRSNVSASISSNGGVTGTTRQSSATPDVKSAIELAEETLRRRMLEHERLTILEKMETAILNFDAAVAKLRREKLKMDAECKAADLKLLTLYQELHLLKDFEEGENRLINKLAKARDAKAQVQVEISDCEQQIQTKQFDIKSAQEKEHSIFSEFNALVGGDKNEFYIQLLKIYNRKIKRRKKRERLHEDDDSDSDTDDASDDDSASESGIDDDIDDSCPLHCDSSIYEQVMELRERRLEQEEMLMNLNKSMLELTKMLERHQQRERQHDKELATAMAEIESFQSEKQKALNTIEVYMPLRLSQIRYLQDGKLPRDMSQGLVFTASGLNKLWERVKDLGNEKAVLSKQLKELKRDHKQLQKELRTRRLQIETEQKKCADVQLLKFGQIIDLSILEKVGEDQRAEDLKDRLKVLENETHRSQTDWESKLQSARDELASVTAENTQWLNQITELTQKQYQLEDQLNNETRRVHISDRADKNRFQEEHNKLLEVVELQEREIDALRAEAYVLSHKTPFLLQ